MCSLLAPSNSPTRHHILFCFDGKCTRAASRSLTSSRWSGVNTQAVNGRTCEPTRSKCCAPLRKQRSIVRAIPGQRSSPTCRNQGILLHAAVTAAVLLCERRGHEVDEDRPGHTCSFPDCWCLQVPGLQCGGAVKAPS